MLRVRLLGGLALTWGDTSLPPISGTVARSLFAYLLAYRDRPHTRDLLAGTFWPELPDDVARRRLSQAVWQIRTALDPYPVLTTSGHTVQINPALPLWIDVEEFAQHAARGKTEDATLAVRFLLPAADLYRGEFLAGYYDDWLFPERERLREEFLDVLESLVAIYKRQGNYQAALFHARRLAIEDPLREQAHREIMRLCCLLGRSGEALQQLETCRRVLAEELGVELSVETTTVAAEIAERNNHRSRIELPQVGTAAPAFLLNALQVSGLPLVGRETERAEILSHVEALFHGFGGAVLIEGEAGVGKTHLLRAIAGDARWRGADVLWGGAQQGGADIPYGPLVEALSGGLSPLRSRQLARIVEEIWLQVLVTLLPALATALPYLPAPPPLGLAQERDRLVHALSRLLAGWAQVVPLLLVVEDLHWAGQDTVDVLARLAPMLGESGVLILASYRGEEARAVPALWQQLQALDRAGVRQRLALKRLDVAAFGELLRRCLGLRSPAPLFEARLFSETEGNPLFLIETLRALHGEGLLFRDGQGNWSTPWDKSTSSYAELPLPTAVEHIIARRLDALPDPLRDIVHLAAVLGERFDFDLVRAVGGQEPTDLLPALRILVQHRFLDESELDYGFCHDKIRQVAYKDIRVEDRPPLHRRAAGALELLQPERWEALAHHWTAAHEWDRAATCHTQAGDRAREVYANADAVRHYTSALDALARLPGQPDPVRVLDLTLRREAVYALQGERALQARDLAAAQRAAAQLEEAQQVRVALRHAQYCVDVSDYPAARDHLERVTSWARAAEDWQTEASALGLLRDVHLRLGDGETARAIGEEVTAIYRSIGDRPGEALSLGACGIACYVAGDLAAAQGYNEQALTLCQALGDRRGEGIIVYRLGRFARDQGSLALAREYLEQALATTELTGDRYYEAYYRLELGNLCYTLGLYHRARETLRQAATIFREIDELRGEGASLMDLGLVYLALGEHGQAQHCCEQGRDLLHAVGDRWTEAAAWNYLGRILEGQGDLEAAMAAFERALEINRDAGQPARTMRDLAGLARIALVRGRMADALGAVQEIRSWISARGITGIEYPLVVFLTVYRVLAAVGQEKETDQVLTAAHALLLERAGRLEDEDLRRSFLEDVAEHRAILAAYQEARTRSIVVHLPRAGVPTGRPVRDDELVTVRWAVEAAEDKTAARGTARRQVQLLRLLEEAAEQGAAPTVEDLAAALGVSAPTVRRDLSALREAGHRVQTRGARAESAPA